MEGWPAPPRIRSPSTTPRTRPRQPVHAPRGGARRGSGRAPTYPHQHHAHSGTTIPFFFNSLRPEDVGRAAAIRAGSGPQNEPGHRRALCSRPASPRSGSRSSSWDDRWPWPARGSPPVAAWPATSSTSPVSAAASSSWRVVLLQRFVLSMGHPRVYALTVVLFSPADLLRHRRPPRRPLRSPPAWARPDQGPALDRRACGRVRVRPAASRFYRLIRTFPSHAHRDRRGGARPLGARSWEWPYADRPAHARSAHAQPRPMGLGVNGAASVAGFGGRPPHRPGERLRSGAARRERATMAAVAFARAM